MAASLLDILDGIESSGFDLVEMVVASLDHWDRYMARQWANVAAWLRANPDHDEVPSVREWFERDQRTYRGSVGWGVFVAMRR